MPDRRHRVAAIATLVALPVVAAACGASSGEAAGAGRPSVVVTTSILGDVVERLVGDEATVEVVMPPGADPHEFQPSARQVATIREADVLVVNGGGFEEGLDDVVASARADGVPTFVAADAADAHADDPEGGEPAEEDASEDDGHDHDANAHFFTDPHRMAEAAGAMVDFLADRLDDVDPAALRATATPYVESLEALDAEVEEILAVVPEEARVLVTTHGVLDPFAERFGFEVLGTVIPGGSTADGASAGALADLAARIEELGLPAIFADTSSPSDLVRTLAQEAGGVEVVELYTESLGEAGSDGSTYVDLVRTNARRIADALAP